MWCFGSTKSQSDPCTTYMWDMMEQERVAFHTLSFATRTFGDLRFDTHGGRQSKNTNPSVPYIRTYLADFCCFYGRSLINQLSSASSFVHFYCTRRKKSYRRTPFIRGCRTRITNITGKQILLRPLPSWKRPCKSRKITRWRTFLYLPVPFI